MAKRKPKVEDTTPPTPPEAPPKPKEDGWWSVTIPRCLLGTHIIQAPTADDALKVYCSKAGITSWAEQPKVFPADVPESVPVEE